MTAAAQLEGLLESVGWTIDGVDNQFGQSSDLFDGVIVSPISYKTTPDPADDPQTRERKVQDWIRAGTAMVYAQEASVTLTTFIEANGWTIRNQPHVVEVPASPVVANSKIVIRVGTKPNPYFLPEALKAKLAEHRRITGEIIRAQKEAQQRQEKWNQEMRQRIEEHQKRQSQPPLVLRPPEDKPKE
jgi:hypothetical protein